MSRTAPQMSASEIEDHAARLLLRREEPGWTASDEAALDAWLNESAAHKAAFWRLEHGWGRTGRLAALRPVAAQPSTRRSLIGWRPAAMAASLALAVGAGVLMTHATAPGRADYRTEVGGHETVPLKDGSRIELNTDTRLRAVVDARARNVWLDRGEAYFEVAHDASRPFVVHAGTRAVTVLGTKFSVRRDGERVTVAVVEGRVRVDPTRDSPRAAPEVITRGDTVIAQGASTLVTAKSVERVAGELSWRRGMLTFDQATLAQAAAEFNRYNTRKLVVADAATAQSRIGGTFEAQNVDAFAHLLQRAYGLKVAVAGDEIRISS